MTLRAAPERIVRLMQAGFRRHRGFTLLELMVVLGIVGVLLSLAIPRAARYLDAIRVRGAAQEIMSVFATARHHAIARARYASVLVDASAGTIEVRSEDRRVLIRDLTLGYGVTLRATRDSMSYSPVGLGYGAANLKITIERGEASDTVVLSRVGRIRRGKR